MVSVGTVLIAAIMYTKYASQGGFTTYVALDDATDPLASLELALVNHDEFDLADDDEFSD